MSHTLINLHDFSFFFFFWQKKSQHKSPSKQALGGDRTAWRDNVRSVAAGRQQWQTDWVDHVLKVCRVAKSYLTVSWRDRSFRWWVTATGQRAATGGPSGELIRENSQRRWATECLLHIMRVLNKAQQVPN